MSLKEVLLQDLKDAMKEKNPIAKNAIQMVRASILQFEKDQKITLDDDGVLELISKELKKRKEALLEFEKTDRTEAIENLKQEIETLKKYLPEPLTTEEIKTIVQDTIQELGAVSPKDMGRVMQAVLLKVRSRADGKEVSQIVKQRLS